MTFGYAAARQDDDDDEMATAITRLMYCLELMFEFVYVLMCMLFIDICYGRMEKQ